MLKKTADTAVLIFLVIILLTSCSEEPASFSLPKSELPMISFQGFSIPRFPTAQGQLNFAKSGFANPEKKKAALEILFEIFPEARLQCGNAALYLAYMNLGNDYRFAESQNYHNAISDYHAVIETFKEHPQILVKAYWYLGWIHSDLLNQTKPGLSYFWHIVKKYPDIKTGISSPVPWVSLVYPLKENKNQPVRQSTQNKWASLALLEIIRHSRDRVETVKAFDTLWEKYRGTVATGIGINLMLKDKSLGQKVMPYIQPYLALKIANPFLAREIKENAKKY